MTHEVLRVTHECGAVFQVYQLSIQAACGLSWPADRIIVQVLDDSTDPTIKVPLLTSTTYLSFNENSVVRNDELKGQNQELIQLVLVTCVCEFNVRGSMDSGVGTNGGAKVG